MWLLNTTTRKLQHFIENIPDYVILSHTWSNGEVTFDDIGRPHADGMPGYSKIMQCCQKALQDGFDWAWVDTCCIDKRSSVELSEAINSMYKWYWDAAICYAFLADVPAKSGGAELKRTFESSRWFKRGWTLQELLAPDTVEFFDETWDFIGTKSSFLESISAATQIDVRYIMNRESIKHASIASKLSWASGRETTRTEDMAYCLLGLVQVNMPMLYGEGDNAFYRLQLEIVKQTNDHTLFAWETNREPGHHLSMFAPSPKNFATAAQIRSKGSRTNMVSSRIHEVTNNGLNITLPCISVDQSRVVAILECVTKRDDRVGVWLERLEDGRFRRLPGARATLAEDEMDDAISTSMYIVMDSKLSENERGKALQLKIGSVHPLLRPYKVAMGNTQNKYFSFKLPEGRTSKAVPMSMEESVNCEELQSYLVNDFMLKDGEVAGVWLFYGRSTPFSLRCGLTNGLPWLSFLKPHEYGYDIMDHLRSKFDMETKALLCSDESLDNFRTQALLLDSQWISKWNPRKDLEKDVNAKTVLNADGEPFWKHDFVVSVQAKKVREGGVLWWILSIEVRTLEAQDQGS